VSLDDSSTPFHQGSFASARTTPWRRETSPPPTRPRARCSHERIGYKKKQNHRVTSRRTSPSRATARARNQSINHKTHTSVAAARTTVAAARTARAVVVARVRASASSRRPADVNVADRAAVGRAHAAGIVAARRVVAIVGTADVAVMVVMVVANMMMVMVVRVRVALPPREWDTPSVSRCPAGAESWGK